MPLPLAPWLPDAIIYHLANPMPGWLLLWVVPRWKWTRRIVLANALVIAALSVGLTVQKMVDYGGFPVADQASMEGALRTLSDPGWGLATMLHVVATDLFVASWLSSEAMQRGVPRALHLALLLISFYPGGAAGLLDYQFLVRPMFGRGGKAAGAQENGVIKQE